MGLVGLVLLAVGVLAAMGQRADAGVSRVTVEIEAPMETVWEWLEEDAKFRQWVSWVESVEYLNPDVKGVGRRTVVEMKEPGQAEAVRVEAVTTSYDPPRSVASEIRAEGVFTGTEMYRLTALDGGRTRVEVENRIRYTPWLFRLIEPLATPMADEKLRGDMASLKAHVEAGR